MFIEITPGSEDYENLRSARRIWFDRYDDGSRDVYVHWTQDEDEQPMCIDHTDPRSEKIWKWVRMSAI